MTKQVRAIVKPKNYTKHGWRHTRLYEIWASMRGRCRNQGHTDFKYYGAKGIKVCPEWEYFVPFRDWALAHGYDNNLTIDRKQNLGNYEPINCRWIPQKEQVKNRNLKLKKLKIFGETKSVLAWLADERCNLTYSALWGRISRGWNLEKALITPLGKNCGKT